MKNYELGNIIKVIVTGTTEYGIFVKIDENYIGLIHISEISDKFVKDPTEFVNENEEIFAEIIDIDKHSKQLKLSIKNIQYRKNGIKKRKIEETKHGFNTLLYKLPFWIDENLKNHKNKTNSIDK